MADLRANLGLRWTEPRILLLGAGGAARGVLGPLLELRPARARHREPHRCSAPISWCASSRRSARSRAARSASCSEEHFDLIINATSASLRGEVPAIPSGVVDALTTCYDMAYGTTETPFTNWGRVHGAERSVQGWGMLVEQAAEAFGLWRGVRPDTAPVLEALRSRMHTADHA